MSAGARRSYLPRGVAPAPRGARFGVYISNLQESHLKAFRSIGEGHENRRGSMFQPFHGFSHSHLHPEELEPFYVFLHLSPGGGVGLYSCNDRRIFVCLRWACTIGKSGIRYWSSQASGLRQIDRQTHAGRPNASRSAVLSGSTSGISPQVRRLRTCIGSGPEVSTPEPTRPPMLGRYPGPRGTR